MSIRHNLRRTFLVAPVSLLAILFLVQPYERQVTSRPNDRLSFAHSVPVVKPCLASLPTQQSVNWSEQPGLPCLARGTEGCKVPRRC